MKLVRFGQPGSERPGIMVDDTTLVDVSSLVPDFDGVFFQAGGTALLEPLGGLPTLDPTGVRLGPPLARPSKVVCIGLNYRRHCEESGNPVPTEPSVFLKAPSSICGPNDDILFPPGGTQLDWEVELGVVIGTRARYLQSPEESGRHVFGYLVANDISERVFQREREGQWTKGKSAETFCPLGPWLVTADEVPDPQALELWLSVNGERRQASTTGDMVFGVNHLIWYLTQFMVLEPGDVVLTGTPEGVALGMKPPQWLQIGDVVEAGVRSLGTQRQVVAVESR